MQEMLKILLHLRLTILIILSMCACGTKVLLLSTGAELAGVDQDVRVETGLSAGRVVRLPKQQAANRAIRGCE